MPFDPFFSSTNKKHYIPVEGADELADELLAMSFEDRQARIRSWQEDNGFTLIERIALKRLHFVFQGKRWANVRKGAEKNIEKAIKELEQGKRVWKPKLNFNTVTGARAYSTNHPKKH